MNITGAAENCKKSIISHDGSDSDSLFSKSDDENKNLPSLTPGFCIGNFDDAFSPAQKAAKEKYAPSFASASSDIIVIDEPQDKLPKESTKNSWPFFTENKVVQPSDSPTDKQEEEPSAVVGNNVLVPVTNNQGLVSASMETKNKNYWDTIIKENDLSEQILFTKVKKIKEAKISHLSLLSRSELRFFILARLEMEYHETVPTKKGTLKDVKAEADCLLKCAFDVRKNDTIFGGKKIEN